MGGGANDNNEEELKEAIRETPRKRLERRLVTKQQGDISLERLFLRRVVKSTAFSLVIYSVIAVNTLIIAIDDTWSQRDNTSRITQVSTLADWGILAIFTVEMLLKMIAFGVGFKPPMDPEEDAELYGYFALGWNRFDCFIVVMTWILTPISVFSGSDISRLVRILRLTRPLRAIRQIKSFTGTQELISCIPISLPSIFDVLNLLVFCLLVFGILGLNLFGLEGKFHGRCVVKNNNHSTAGFLALPSPALCGGGWNCGEGFRCSCLPKVFDDGSIEERPYSYTDTLSGDIGCMRQGSSRPWAEGSITDRPVCPNYGYACFDNFALAVFTCFSSITLDSWSQTMWWAQDSLEPVGGWIFFVILIVFVSFNVINLFVASMSNAYREVRNKRLDLEKMKLVESKRAETKIRRAVLAGEMQQEDAAMLKSEAKLKKEAERTFLDRLLDPQRYIPKKYRNTWPLNPIALLIRKVTVYPQTVDESGNVVTRVLERLARERNIHVKWGPTFGRWQLIAKPGGVRTVPVERERVQKTDENGDDDESKSEVKLRRKANFEDQVVEGEVMQSAYKGGSVLASGESKGEARKELKDKLLMFERVTEEKINVNEDEKTPILDIVILISILLNIATAAVDHYDGIGVDTNMAYPPELNCCNADCSISNPERCPRGLVKMQPEWYLFAYYTELAFNSIFSLEMFLKIISFWSITGFLKDQFPSNIIDICIVLISDIFFVLDLFFPKIFSVAIFRLIRLVRALRLATRLRRLKLLVNKAMSAASTVVYVLFLMLFLHIIAALVAMQLFSCSPRQDDVCKPIVSPDTILPGTVVPANITVCPQHCTLLLGSPPQCVFTDKEIYEHCPWDMTGNFDSFGMSMVQLFYVTTGDNNWITTLAQGMRSLPTPWPGLFFFLFFYGVSVYMIYSLFVCVILEEFELSDDQKESLQVGQYRVKKIKAIIRKQQRFETQKKKATASGKQAPQMDFNIAAFLTGDYTAITDDVAKFLETDKGAEDNVDDRLDDPVDILFCVTRPLPDRHLPHAPRNLRWWVHYIVNSRWYTGLTLLVIIASSIMLALETPIDSANLLNKAGDSLRISDYVFFAFFAIEFILKILLHGIFWEHKEAYFRQAWNILDFVILVMQILDVSGIEGLKSLRVLRVLRPLRLLNKIRSLQLIIMALWRSTADIFNVLLLWLFGYIAFAVIGMYLFGGKLYRCSDESFVGPPLNPLEPLGSNVGWRENCVGQHVAFATGEGDAYVSFWDPTGIYKPRVWANPPGFDFDNFANAMQTMFEASTLRHWSYYVNACSDAVAFGQHPILGYNRSAVIFYMAWVVISCFFVLQMVVGVLIDSINQQTGTALYTFLQRNWIRTEAKILELTPLEPIDIPQDRVRNLVWMIVNHPIFQNSITVIIIINIIFMATESYDQPQYWQDLMTILNWIFIAVYVAEILLKCVAYLHLFFFSLWNLFDLFVVLASIVDELVSAGGGGSGLQALRVLRILRVARAFRLVRRNPRLRLILNTLMSSIPSVLSIITFMFLYIFLFAKIANQFFCGLKYGNGIARRNNFDTTWDALLALFVVITGDGWQGTMRDVGIVYPMCTTTDEVTALRALGLHIYFPDPKFDTGDCSSTAGAVVFFDVFFFIGYNVLRSAFIAVLMENFFAFKVQGTFMISESHLGSFQRVWREYDPTAEGKLPTWKLREFLNKLADDRNPLGLTVLQNEFKFQTFRVEMTHGKENTEYMEFTPLLHTLGLHTVGPKAFLYEDMLVRQDKVTWFGQIAACEKLVAIYRGMKERKLKNAKSMGLITTGSLAAITEDVSNEDKRKAELETEVGAEALVRHYRTSVGKARTVERLTLVENHPSMMSEDGTVKRMKRSYKPPVPKSTVTESSLARLAPLELDKHLGLLTSMVENKHKFVRAGEEPPSVSSSQFKLAESAARRTLMDRSLPSFESANPEPSTYLDDFGTLPPMGGMGQSSSLPWFNGNASGTGASLAGGAGGNGNGLMNGSGAWMNGSGQVGMNQSSGVNGTRASNIGNVTIGSYGGGKVSTTMNGTHESDTHAESVIVKASEGTNKFGAFKAPQSSNGA